MENDTWLRDCYRRIHRWNLEEIFIVRNGKYIDIYVVGEDFDIIVAPINNFIQNRLGAAVFDARERLDDEHVLRYFINYSIGRGKSIPADPTRISHIKEEFNIALDEGAVGGILTEIYRRTETFSSRLQNDPFIRSNQVNYSEILLDMAEKIFGELTEFQYIFLGFEKHLSQNLIQTINRSESVKLFIYHSDFDKAYHTGLQYGCIPINLEHLKYHLQFDSILLNFQPFNTDFWQFITSSVKGNKNGRYVFFDLTNSEKMKNLIRPANLFYQTDTQINNLIQAHLGNRRLYLEEISEKIDKEIREYYDWFYSDLRYVTNNIVSADRRMQKVFELVRRIAPSDISILITGETGTGKELIARAIHENSHRAPKSFVAVNCSAIPVTLLESELFGHEKGSFTGALSTKKGLIEQSSGGTLFLDEIGDLPPVIQVKLLRVLQEREIMRIGNTTPISVDIRLVSATNRKLPELAESEKFRPDLYYRLNTVQINLPPLRERKKDIPLLTSYFLKKLNRQSEKYLSRISDDVLKRFMIYDWPGNVRELENIIERAFAVAIGNEITMTDLPTRLQYFTAQIRHPAQAADQHAQTLKQLEESQIKDLIINKRVKLNQAAQILGIGRTTLWRKMRQLGIDREDIEDNRD